MVFSTNQANQVYVASAYKAKLAENDAVGTIAVLGTPDKDLYFQHIGAGGITRSDLINNIIHGSVTDAKAIARKLKTATVTLDSNINSGNPVAGQDYVLNILFSQVVSLSEEDTYTKTVSVRATSGMTASNFYKALGIALALNFSKEATKLVGIYLKTSAGLTEVTSINSNSNIKVTKGGKVPCTEITLAELNENMDKWESRRVKVVNSNLTTALDADNDAIISQDGNSITIFEKIDGKDRNYVTNSYHVPVFEKIDAFSKLAIESQFQKLSPGGAISYVEVPNMQQNISAVLQLIKFIYENIMYAEINTKSDYCQKCGYTGEILIDEKMNWYCPNCGNRDHDTLNVARRTCGYIGTNFWNYGRTEEIKERVIHLD